MGILSSGASRMSRCVTRPINSVPPLVTTSVPGTPRPQAGVLGEPGTIILFPGDTNEEDPRSGVLVTVNSDDPAYFGGYADTNYEALRATFDFSDEMMARLARNSVTASFLPKGRKTELLREIDRWLAT